MSMQQAMLAVMGGPKSYSNGFENTTVADSSSGTLSLTIIEDDGSISTGDKYAGSKSYYANSVSAAANRLVLAVPVADFNSCGSFVVEYWFKKISGDTYPTQFHLIGGASAQQLYLRPDSSAIGAGTGTTNVGDITSWCTWGDWNKLKFLIDRTSASNNATISVNDVVKFTGTVPQTWTAYSGSDVYVSFFQFADSAASDNGIEGYMDDLSIRVE